MQISESIKYDKSWIYRPLVWFLVCLLRMVPIQDSLEAKQKNGKDSVATTISSDLSNTKKTAYRTPSSEDQEDKQLPDEVPEGVESKRVGRGREGAYQYGWWQFKPKYLQVFATPVWALVFLCLQTLMQGIIVNGILRQFAPMIEIRFGLSSFKSGIMMGAFDFAIVLCLIPVTYLGGAKNSDRPQYVGFGTMILGTGSIVFSLPAFLTEPYRPGKPDLCTDTPKEPVTSENMDSFFLMYCMLVVGNFLHGVGATPFFTLSISYIDDFVEKEQASIYLGIYYMMAVIGPALGFLFGGLINDIHVDFFRPSQDMQKDITPSSTVWVGAWWLGFVVGGLVCYFTAIPVLGLPKKLSVTQRKGSLMDDDNASMPEEPTIRYFLPSLMHVLKHYSFMFLTLAGCCEGVILSGMGSFMPKLLRRQFGFSPPKVATIMGSVAIPSCLIGLLCGAFIINKWNLATTSILKLCICLTGIAGLLQLGLLIHCKENIPGDLSHVIGGDMELLRWGLEEKCNGNCHCEGSVYFPVCDIKGSSYFSPCTAGCWSVKDISKSMKFYYNCSCIKTMSEEGWSGKTCEEECALWKVLVFLTGVFFYQTVTFSACIPALTATLRSIPRDFKSLALGVQWLMVRILGSVPGPMLYGALIDDACTYWPNDVGACIVYDQVLLSRNIVVFGLSFKVLQLFCFFVAYELYKRLRDA